MRAPLHFLRLLTILLITYVSIFGGVVEQDALMHIVHQVGFTALLIAWLLILWRERRPFPVTPLDWPLLGLGLAWTLSAIFSRHPRISLEYAWLIWAVILAYYLIVDLMQRGSRWQLWIFEGLFLTGALFVGFAVAEMVMWYLGIDILSPFAQGWPSLFGFTKPPTLHAVSLPLNNTNLLGAYCVLIVPLAFAGVQTAPRRDIRLAMGGLSVALAGVAVATQSRGAIMGLGTVAGLITLAYLLRAETRQHLPYFLRRLLSPTLLIGVWAVVALGGVGFIFFVTVRSRDTSSLTRLDLWVSAMQIIADHPLTGAGPRMFGSERLWYPHWKMSHSYLVFTHAHNLYLHWLAEGGLIVLVPTLGLLDQLRRTWWKTWQTGDTVRRRRLEGAAIALAAYTTHNLVDTFLHTKLMVPLIIIGAYIVAGDKPRSLFQVVQQRRMRLSRVILALLVAVQIAFIPLHRGLWAHRQALAQRANGNLIGALDAERRARSADPWNDLYQMQEATILGELAALYPQQYLDEAITAFEDALQRNTTWDVGWHNLAALYAQAGRLEDAVAAEQQAIAWDRLDGGYFMKLGEYYDLLGEREKARSAFLEALRTWPWLASCGFWSDPARPQWHSFLGETAASMLPTHPDMALDIAVYGGLNKIALFIARAQQAAGNTRGSMNARLVALWPGDPQAPPCWTCYDPVLRTPNLAPYIARAEWLMSQPDAPTEGLSAEQAARAVIFLSENRNGWAWYILARAAERAGAPAEVINEYLGRTLRYPHDFRFSYDTTVFTLHGELSILPQAQTPIMSRQNYEPWLYLAARYEASGNLQNARVIYERFLAENPYAWDIRQHLNRLSEG
ncbi:MAG: hypothetical protein Kow00106_11620 [Anaerolineae bacterium]